MSKPLVSVIVPCYNVEKYLDRCLESLITQTLSEIEIVLVDDLSPDSTPQLCDKWAEKDDRIKVVHKKKNGGLGFARNSGLEVASGEYVMFLDSDDTYEPDACEKMYQAAITEAADVVTGNFITEVQPNIWETTRNESGDKILDGNGIREYILDVIASAPYIGPDRLYPVSVCLLLMKKSIIDDNGIRFYSEREVASEDTLFKISFLKNCRKMVCLDFPFYHYFLNGASLSHTFKPAIFDSLKTLRARLIEIMGDGEEELLRINRFIISDIRMHITRLVESKQQNKLKFVKEILNDDIWRDLSSYKPEYYGLYGRMFYNLCLWNTPSLLLMYAWSVSKMRKMIRR